MRVEFLPWRRNVARFRLEERVPPTLRLARLLAPDPADVREVAEAFRLAPVTPEARRSADAEMARRLAALDLAGASRRRRMTVDVLLAPAVEGAVAACVAFEQAPRQALAAQEAAAVAARHGEELEGVVRAARLALRSVAWRPYDSGGGSAGGAADAGSGAGRRRRGVLSA